MGAFSSCGGTLLLPYEENTPGFRVPEYSTSFKPGTSTPRDRNNDPWATHLAASGTRLRLAALAVHAQRARIRISLRRIVTVQARRAVAGALNAPAGINNRL